jgi:hypothetical protein
MLLERLARAKPSTFHHCLQAVDWTSGMTLQAQRIISINGSERRGRSGEGSLVARSFGSMAKMISWLELPIRGSQ